MVIIRPVPVLSKPSTLVMRPREAITVENNLAYIDPQKCKLCRKCVNECPTGAIRLVGMDPLPKAPKAPATPATPAAPKAGAAPKVEN